jgi:hypothetical protein
MRTFIIALTAIGLVAGSAPAAGAPCRDAKGKFVKCAHAKVRATHCRDAHGKFVTCGRKGAKPA